MTPSDQSPHLPYEGDTSTASGAVGRSGTAGPASTAQWGGVEAPQQEDAGPGAAESAPIPSTPEEGVEAKIRHIEEMVQHAKSMPLSSSVLLPRDELLMLLADLRESLPKELRQARWILREKDEFIARARREAELIVEEAQAEASRIVSETEIMREAEWKAGIVIGEAEERARTLKAETDGYIDAKLASFEALLRRMLETIVAGRERLRAVPQSADEGFASSGSDGSPPQSGLRADGAEAPTELDPRSEPGARPSNVAERDRIDGRRRTGAAARTPSVDDGIEFFDQDQLGA